MLKASNYRRGESSYTSGKHDSIDIEVAAGKDVEEPTDGDSRGIEVTKISAKFGWIPRF